MPSKSCHSASGAGAIGNRRLISSSSPVTSAIIAPHRRSLISQGTLLRWLRRSHFRMPDALRRPSALNAERIAFSDRHRSAEREAAAATPPVYRPPRPRHARMSQYLVEDQKRQDIHFNIRQSEMSAQHCHIGCHASYLVVFPRVAGQASGKITDVAPPCCAGPITGRSGHTRHFGNIFQPTWRFLGDLAGRAIPMGQLIYHGEGEVFLRCSWRLFQCFTHINATLRQIRTHPRNGGCCSFGKRMVSCGQ